MSSVLRFLVHCTGFFTLLVCLYMLFVDPLTTEVLENAGKEATVAKYVMVGIVIFVWGGTISLIDWVSGKRRA